MKKPTFDPGLTQRFTGVLRRSINKDGSFNVHGEAEAGAIFTRIWHCS